MAVNCARRKRGPASSRECGCGTARLSWRSSAKWAASRAPSPRTTRACCAERERKVFRAHGDEQCVTDDARAAFRRRQSEAITLPMTMASPAQVLMRPFKAFKTYRCHTQSASVLSKTSTPTVVSAAAASQMSMVAFLFQRSESGTGKNAQKHIRRIRADGEQRGAERRAALLIRPNDERKACHKAAERGKHLRRPQAQKRA